jgi:hypothetical protein
MGEASGGMAWAEAANGVRLPTLPLTVSASIPFLSAPSTIS